MGFDELLKTLGEFGRYQRRIYILLCLPAISCALHKLASVFLAPTASHRCLMPYEVGETNVSYFLPEDKLNLSIPFDESTKSYSQCSRYDANFTDEYFEDGIPSGIIVACEHWVFDLTKYASSLVFEWELVCNKQWLKATADTIFMFGVLLGSVIFGDLSDRFGRKPIFFISLALQVVFGIFAAIAPEYISFVICRLVIGATTSGVFLVAYVIGMEMVGPSKRLYAGVIVQYFFTFGYILTAFFAYFITDWRVLQAALSGLGIIFLIYKWIIPESARWLLTKGKVEEAKAVIRNVAKENQVEIGEEMLDKFLDESILPTDDKKPQPQSSYMDLIRYPNLRKKSLIIFFLWFVNSGSYYGLSWNTNNLGGNHYLNFLYSGLVEIPGYTFLLLALNRWGRKLPLCGAMLTAGVVLISTILVPKDMNWLLITLAMFGKMTITASYGTVYIFTAEQFPTVIRNTGLGISSTIARVGGMLAPYLIILGEHWKPLPLIIIGTLALIGGMLALLLPETLNRKLPETIEDGENFVGLKKRTSMEDEMNTT